MVETRSSKRQRELLNFVDGFIKEQGYGPSYREVMNGLGYKSVSTVAIHIDGLIGKGYLRKKDNSARSLEVVTAHFDDTVSKKTTNQSQEKWLLSEINERVNDYELSPETPKKNDLHILIESLRILGFEESYFLLSTRLEQLEKLEG